MNQKILLCKWAVKEKIIESKGSYQLVSPITTG
jgi:hypothetical protein